ncbi:MAG TPA: prolyl oligopeptidase family serine peptidase, partial [Candidatus Dormibacteraeota bacterium]|nr:prolyl oligopeptidase family serine peptidase [Candidatus Dormibacteraeota bacterium]
MLGIRRLIVACLGVVVVMGVSAVPASAATTTHTGAFTDGATYLIEVPSPWNGTLLLYSHGYVRPGSPNPAFDVGDPGTRAFLLSQGFALAGSSYATTGWALKDAFIDQIATLDTFAALVGKPKRTIAWGHSLGGIITAGLLQRNPGRFDAALPMCGVLAGGVGVWNEGLDGE